MSQLIEFAQHHTLLFAAFGAVLLLFIANEVHGALTGGVRLSPPDAVRLINDRDALVVDLRPVAEYKKGHLMNALSLPVTKLDERIGELGKDKARPVLLYCALGNVAGEAALKLRKLGFSEVYPLSGGINNWQGSNLPVTAK
jgi:rhodanese-related sulfurtransferase